MIIPFTPIILQNDPSYLGIEENEGDIFDGMEKKSHNSNGYEIFRSSRGKVFKLEQLHEKSIYIQSISYSFEALFSAILV